MRVSPLRKLLWVLAAVAAMVLLAPVVATAHEGHARSATVHAATHHTLAHSYHLVRAEGTQSSATQPSERAGSDQGWLCPGGCCSGMGCCAETVVSVVPSVRPPSGRLQLVRPVERQLTSAHSTPLLEPPDLLA